MQICSCQFGCGCVILICTGSGNADLRFRGIETLFEVRRGSGHRIPGRFAPILLNLLKTLYAKS